MPKQSENNQQSNIQVASPVYTVAEWSRSKTEIVETVQRIMQLQADNRALEAGKPSKHVTAQDAENAIVRSLSLFARGLGIGKDDSISKDHKILLNQQWKAFGVESAASFGVVLGDKETFRGCRLKFSGKDTLGLPKFVDRVVTTRRSSTVQEKVTYARNTTAMWDRWISKVTAQQQ